jgi:hypothetical protein
LDNITSDDGRIIRRKREWRRNVVGSGRAIIKMEKETIILCHCQHARGEGGRDREREGGTHTNEQDTLVVVVPPPSYCHHAGE